VGRSSGDAGDRGTSLVGAEVEVITGGGHTSYRRL
jgi:hypothetical protein